MELETEVNGDISAPSNQYLVLLFLYAEFTFFCAQYGKLSLKQIVNECFFSIKEFLWESFINDVHKK